MKGYVQIYTGDGKGKTTAAFGLALRAAGAGLKVFIGQFCKGRDYSELKAFDLLKEWIALKQFGPKHFIMGKPKEEDYERAKRALKEVRDAIFSGKYDVVILDEANIAISMGLLKVEDIADLIKNKPENVELVITGRNAPKELIDLADLVTEMREIKHYYKNGVLARDGIEK